MAGLSIVETVSFSKLLTYSMLKNRYKVLYLVATFETSSLPDLKPTFVCHLMSSEKRYFVNYPAKLVNELYLVIQFKNRPLGD